MSEEEVSAVDDALTAAIELSQDQLVDAIVDIEKRILRLIGRLETTADGTIKGPKVTLATAQKIHKQLIELFAKFYGKEARKHVNRYRGIQKLVRDVYKSLGAKAVEFTEVNENALRILAQQDLALHRSLSRETQARVGKAVYTHILSMGNIDELEKEIQGILTGHVDVRGRPMSTYAKTYAQDQVMQYHASANKALGEQNNVKHWWYVGDVIETSRDFCEDHAGETKTEKEWEKIGITQDWAGKSCSDIFVCRGGYNCRHHFQAVITA